LHASQSLLGSHAAARQRPQQHQGQHGSSMPPPGCLLARQEQPSNRRSRTRCQRQHAVRPPCAPAPRACAAAHEGATATGMRCQTLRGGTCGGRGAAPRARWGGRSRRGRPQRPGCPRATPDMLLWHQAAPRAPSARPGRPPAPRARPRCSKKKLGSISRFMLVTLRRGQRRSALLCIVPISSIQLHRATASKVLLYNALATVGG